MTADADLKAVLGAAPPDSISALPEETLTRLAGQVKAAKERQDADMERSVQVAIDGVPFAVRGIVRKALRG
jgi:hypothetical protein